MRGLLLSLSQLFSRLLVGLLVLSTQLLWAQGTSTREESAVPLPDAPSEVQTHPHLTHKEFHLTFKQNQGQTDSRMRFFPDRTGYNRLSVNINAVLSQDSGTIEFRVPNKYFICSAPTKRMTFAPIFGRVHQETIHGIPWVGPVIVRIDKEAKAHPHITTVLKTVRPQF
jgi:hypothetical protein